MYHVYKGNGLYVFDEKRGDWGQACVYIKYVYIHIHTHVYIHVYVYIYIYMCVYIHDILSNIYVICVEETGCMFLRRGLVKWRTITCVHKIFVRTYTYKYIYIYIYGVLLNIYIMYVCTYMVCYLTYIPGI